MPDIGDKRRTGKNTQIWVACPDCNKERWVRLNKGKPINTRCNSCSAVRNILPVATKRGAENHNWKGGRQGDGEGYILVKLQHNDFFYPMAAKSGYVREHRLVMAKHLNRCLLPWEVVHHRNGIRDDNRIENLMLLPHNIYQVSDSILKNRVKILEKKVEKHEKEIRLLRWQIKEIIGGKSPEEILNADLPVSV